MTEQPTCYRCKQPMTPRGECGCADGICLVHGDCRNVLPLLEEGSMEVLLTDPPWKASDVSLVRVQGGVAPSYSPSLKYGDIGTWDATVIAQCLAVPTGDCFILSGYKELGETLGLCGQVRGVFVWHKPNGGRSVAYPTALDTAFIVWTGKKSSLYGFQHWRSGVFSIPVPSAGCMRTERILAPGSKKAAHPAQGPLRLYRELLKPFTDAQTVVLDPFVGSGTTLVAAKQLGRKALGIEIESRYCDIATERLRQGMLF